MIFTRHYETGSVLASDKQYIWQLVIGRFNASY